jgi:hypothetical protein
LQVVQKSSLSVVTTKSSIDCGYVFQSVNHKVTEELHSHKIVIEPSNHLKGIQSGQYNLKFSWLEI